MSNQLGTRQLGLHSLPRRLEGPLKDKLPPHKSKIQSTKLVNYFCIWKLIKMTLSTFSWFSYIQPFGFSVFLLRTSFSKQKCDLSHLSVLRINMEISNTAFIILQGTYTMPTSCLSLPQASQSMHCRYTDVPSVPRIQHTASLKRLFGKLFLCLIWPAFPFLPE